MRKKVFLGMSGGVDSSLAAVLLQEQGYDVTGVFMKNWSRDLPGAKCPWAEDLADAKRVATRLGIDFKIYDFEEAYKQKVVDVMIAEFKAGHTPNPDILCNQEIKFKLFYDRARADGADLIATGHYAQGGAAAEASDYPHLLTAVDSNKDQTYFLYRMPAEALAQTLFPIGHLKKPDVKRLAAEHGLPNAYKKESMGVCFVGNVSMSDFLATFIAPQAGPIVDADTGQTLGTHTGAAFYTIGQRHGLYLGGGLPYHVTGKDLQQNIVYVSRNLNATALWTDSLQLENVLWRPHQTPDEMLGPGKRLLVRLRHRAPLLSARLDGDFVRFDQPVKRPAAGQSAVFYTDGECLGGGVVTE